MIRKNVAVLVAAIICSGAMFAQVTVDPQNDFYDLALNWYNRGIVESLPPVRPYPYQNVKAIIDQVLENGTERDKEDASLVYERMTGKKLYVYLDADGFLKLEKAKKDGENESNTGKNIYLCPGVQGDRPLFEGTDRASFGYRMGITVSKHPDTDFKPMYSTPAHDAIYDPSEFGPLTMYLDVNTAVAYGTENLFVQGGIYRNGYGKWLNEGLALNDSGFHKTNLSMTWMEGKVSYTQQVSMLGSTSAYDGNIGSLGAGKILGFHAISYEVCDWFDFSFYETTVIGNRFDICTLLPVPYMISEELTGAGDGVFMGLAFNVKPVSGITWANDVMVDDFPIDEFLKANLDSKYRLAAKTGIIWTPEESVVEKVGLSYTAITPYTYSHWEYDRHSDKAKIGPGMNNYQDYTNNGIKIGSQYEPDSDAIQLSVDLRPVNRLKMNVHGSLSRHGNISESLTDEEAAEYLSADKGTYATDGSVYQHSMYSNPDGNLGRHVDTAWNHLNFMTQDHIMTTVKIGSQAEYLLSRKSNGSSVTLKGGFDIEYIHNYGVGNEMFPGLGSSYDGGKTAAGGEKALVEKYRKAWEDQLCNKTNFYFNIGVSIRY
ncbi:hypothetical protein [Treponema sp.]|uniref:hypothetical protein n=1 Tax=Treponema sp. TaxID=166 RepID=UPI00298DE432|nr:hypothetical protein [Treponema sp.]MCQ2240624.1 hypothetical protein [Treponema sp.]